MEKYTIETLIKINGRFHETHRITQGDVDMANRYREIIKKSRTDDRIQPGDFVEYTNEYGDYYRNAHFEKLDTETDQWSVCEQPQIPFIYLTEDKSNIKCFTSGGIWSSLPNKMKLIGKRMKYLWTGGIAEAAATVL